MIPLDDVLTTVTTWCGDLHITSELPDDGREWVDVGALARPEPARQSVAAMLAADANGDRGVAGAFHGLYLAHAVAGPLAAAAIGLHAVWAFDGGPVYARVHPDGRWFDAVAIVGARTRCSGDAGLTTSDDVLAAAAAGLIVFLDPIFTQIATFTRYGLPGMWGHVADQIHHRALATGREPTDAWAAAARLTDHLAARVPLRTRPRLHSGTTSMVNGTCCLLYRTHTDPAGCDTGHCSVCPRLDRSAPLRNSKVGRSEPGISEQVQPEGAAP
ncbi:hypothetical protein O7627_32240 [Solwaraspora sp. WMMD1047]|uniref:hypothetical protein n=1 Tax=Solwaraspora sp. WMMD1047 TaxID=3016102 RepID=UPI0024168EFA|nr:hypothetical protein [Solwaraspora sp. WMMD1047]MDG4833941.1 hypothetical protein [Solwaraspora sp. WMMD1047]